MPALTIPCLPAEHYRYLQTLHWENVHTTRIRQEIGDDKLCMAYSPQAACWVLARKVRVHVKVPGLAPALVETPFIWMNWVGPAGEALPPDDPRLITTIRFGDTWTRGDKAIVGEVESSENAHHEAADKALADHHEDVAKELRPALAKAASELGLVHHRDTGNDAKKITSAGIWKGN